MDLAPQVLSLQTAIYLLFKAVAYLMLKRVLFFVVLASFVGLLSSAPAKADSFGSFSLTSCGTAGTGCPGATYSFDVTSTSATLKITINGAVTAGVNDHLMGVDLGFAPSNILTGVALSSVSGVGNSLSLWSTVDTGSLSNGGCGGNGGAFVCASSATPTPDGVALITGDTYSWTWTYNAIPLADIDAASDVHVGANYDPHTGYIVSETLGQAMPEPGTLALLAAGLLGLAVWRRRSFAVE